MIDPEPTPKGRLGILLMPSMAAAAENEERDDKDPDPVVVEKTAKAAGVASTVRVHKNLPSAAKSGAKIVGGF